METYKYNEAIQITLKSESKKRGISKPKTFEEEIAQTKNMNIIETTFLEIEKNTLKLLESNKYFLKYKEEDSDFEKYLEENNLLIKKNCYKLDVIMNHIRFRVPNTELLTYKEKLENILKEVEINKIFLINF